MNYKKPEVYAASALAVIERTEKADQSMTEVPGVYVFTPNAYQADE